MDTSSYSFFYPHISLICSLKKSPVFVYSLVVIVYSVAFLGIFDNFRSVFGSDFKHPHLNIRLNIEFFENSFLLFFIFSPIFFILKIFVKIKIHKFVFVKPRLERNEKIKKMKKMIAEKVLKNKRTH